MHCICGETMLPVKMGCGLKVAKRFVCALAFLLSALTLGMPAHAELSFLDFFKEHNAVILVIEPGSGQIVEANQAASRFYGYSRAELRAMGIQDINALTSEEVAQERLRAETEKRNYFIFRHRLKNGDIKTVEVHSSPYTYQGKDVLISVINDISAQRAMQDDLWHYQTQLEQMVDRQTSKLIENHRLTVTMLVIGIAGLVVLILALVIAVKSQNEAKRQAQNKRQQLDDIIWSTNVGTFEWDIPTGQVQINDRFAQMLGYTVAELEPITYETWTDNTHPDDLKIAQALIQKNFAGVLDHYETEFRMMHKDGHYVWILSKGNVVEWAENGQPMRMTGTHSDITQRKAMEEALRKAKQDAEDANRAKSEFLATMSHELRTPMMGIRGVLELLRDNDVVLAQERGLLDDLDESSRNLMILLDDILDLSKIEAGKLRLVRNVRAPSDIVRNVANLFAPSAQKKNIHLKTNAADLGDYWCMLDDIRFRQVVSNLVSNAVKFTDEGYVEVLLEVQKGQGHRRKDILNVSVRDTGIGIDEDYIANIFSRFSQVDQSLSKKYGGTGLGLAISHELSEMMGGELMVQSEVGKGSVFTLSLPVEQAAKPVKNDNTRTALEPLNILMAEDNLINQKVISAMLSKNGHAVTIASNGREAVEEAAKEAFDLVLMDIQMPEMDGLEATREIRRTSGPNARKPIIAFTADAVKEHHEDFFKAGIDTIIIKPVKFEDLNEEIARSILRE